MIYVKYDAYDAWYVIYMCIIYTLTFFAFMLICLIGFIQKTFLKNRLHFTLLKNLLKTTLKKRMKTIPNLNNSKK